MSSENVALLVPSEINGVGILSGAKQVEINTLRCPELKKWVVGNRGLLELSVCLIVNLGESIRVTSYTAQN